MPAMKPNTVKVLKYLQSHADEDLTSADVAEALGLEKRQVDGIFTRAFQCKKLGEREPAEITLDDGSHQKVKFLRLNEEGLNLDPDSGKE